MVDVEDSSGEDSGLVSVQGRQGNVTFKPYRDIKTKAVHVDQEARGTPDTCPAHVDIDNLYPELLCHIFSYLDTISKGNSAQLPNIFNFPQSSISVETTFIQFYLSI